MNLINLNAEIGANLIGDDAQPTLEITNTSTGPALKLDRAVITGSATVTQLTIDAGILAANATVTALNVEGASRASGAVLALKGDAFTSVTTIKFITGGVAGSGAIRVVYTDGTFGWIPVLPDAAVTAAAVP